MDTSAQDISNILIPVIFSGIFLAFTAFIFWQAIRSAKKSMGKLKETALKLGLQYSDSETAVSGSSMPQAQIASDQRVAALSPDQLRKASGFLRMFFPLLGTWHISGTYSGRIVDIHQETRGTGKSSTTYTIFRVKFKKPVGADLHLSREGFLSKLGKAVLHTQDIQLNDPEFDGKVMVKGSDESKVKTFLVSPASRKAVLDYFQENSGAVIDDIGIYFEEIGIRTEENEHRKILDRMVHTADALER
jgi:hypothetical protein